VDHPLAREASRRVLASLSFAALACAPVSIPGPPDDPSLYAGWKAGAACSAIFLGGRAFADVLVDELGGLPPGAAAIPDPVVDFETRTVAVRHAADRPPRLAVYRDGMGCTTLPAGATLGDAAALPRTAPVALEGDPARIPWPDGDRIPEEPAADAVDRARLERVLAAAFDGETYGERTKTIGVVVVERGRLVGERYRPGFGAHVPYRTWSVAKSLTNALVGILVGEGRLRVDEPAPIPEWPAPGDPRSRIRVEHLLHMSSGLERSGAVSYPVYFGGADSIAEITSAPLEVEPGTRWLYANRDTLLLVRAMRRVIGDDAAYLAFPRRALFDRIGMRSTVPEVDWRGNFVLSSQVSSTARDLARFGLLYLRDGVWNGERILPEGWVAYTREPAPARRTGLSALWSYGLAGLAGYGAQFWLLGGIPFVPDDAYSALGSRGQCVTIVPSRDLVVVRTGLDAEYDDVFWRQDRFLRDVIGALAD
jgi:CubicO group peptidase (beta-lactamase class C family)